jgi:hypothetical protein
MKNRYLKAAIISSTMAILVGVVTFGVNVVSGVDNPGASPAGSEGVVPTFSGATFTGDVELEGRSQFTGDATFEGRTTFEDRTTFSSGIRVEGMMLITEALRINIIEPVGSMIRIRENVYLEDGDLIIDPFAVFRTSTSDDGSPDNWPLVLDDSLDLSGRLIGRTGGTFNGRVYIDDTTGSDQADLTVDDQIALNSSIDVSAAGAANDGRYAFKIDHKDNDDILAFDANEILSINTALFINADSDENVIIGQRSDADLVVGQVGSASNLKVNGNTEISGDLEFTGGATVSSGNDMFGDFVSMGDGNIYSGMIAVDNSMSIGRIFRDDQYLVMTDDKIQTIGAADLKLDSGGGDVRVTNGNNLDIEGHLSAGSLGRFTVRYPRNARYLLLSTGYDGRNISCNAGEIVVSCGAEGYQSEVGGSTSKAVGLQGVHMNRTVNPSACYVSVHNPYHLDRWYKPYVTCFNPNI